MPIFYQKIRVFLNLLSTICLFLLAVQCLISFSNINTNAQATISPTTPPAKPTTPATGTTTPAKPTTTPKTTTPPAKTAPTTIPNGSCNLAKTEVKIWNLATPGAFLPLIPQECAFDGAKYRPLSLEVLPDLFIRVWGLMASTGFYMLIMTATIAGLFYTYSGFDAGSESKAKTIMQNALIGLALLAGTYVIIFTMLNLLGVGTVDTDLKNFFV